MIYETIGLPDDDPPGVPLIGWNNVVSEVIASSEAEGFPADNLLNPATHLLWKATSVATQQLALTTTGDSNYIAIAKHNFTRIGFGFTSSAEAARGTLMSLLHFESGGDGSVTFQDRSGNAHGWAASGNAQLDNAQFKFGSLSCVFDGTGDFLRTDGPQFAFGDEDFTIDMQVRLNTTGTEKTLVDARASEPQIAVLLRITSANVLQLFVNGTNRITGATALTTGAWFHVALTRSGTDTKLWLNGVQQGSTYSDSNTYIASSIVRVGANFSGTSGHNGWIDEFRLLKGEAAWNAAFTPPTVAYADGVLPAIGKYELLLYFEGTDGSTAITDSGSNDAPHTITTHGNAQIDTAQFKFDSASLLLDGTGDWINVAEDGTEDFDFSGDFTIEFSVRFNSLTGTQVLADWRSLGTATPLNQFFIFKFTDNAIWMQLGSGGIVGSTVVTTGTWYHVALTRSGSNFRLFVDGVQQGSTLVNAIPIVAGDNRPAFGVAGDVENASFLNGWLDMMVIVKGTAFWTTNFVPRTVSVGTYTRDFTRPLDDDKPIILRHSGLTSSTSLVLKVLSDEIPQAAVIYAGQLLALERGVKWDVQHQHLPHARRSNIVNGMSESGNFLGRVVLSEWREGKAEFAWFTPDWYRENFEPFVQSAITHPFFWAWNPDDYPEETSFAWLIEDIVPETDPVTRRVAATISMRAIE